MPRTNYCRSQREIKKEKFSRWVRGQLAMNGFNQGDLASVLGISQQGLSYKIRKSAFDVGDVVEILHFFNADPKDVADLFLY